MIEFDELGRAIETAWAKVDYNETEFPAIVAEEFENTEQLEDLDVWDIVDWGLEQSVLPEQRDIPGKFGDPPITLFNAPRFHVDAYFWLDGTTSIHQHGFCGAFRVLEGSSIHSRYRFEEEKSVNVFMKTGKLQIESCELLEKDSIQKILPGEQYIHSLFHLDQPSVTLVARTHKSPLNLPQYSYYRPGLAMDPFYEEVETTKKIQILTAMFRAKRPDVMTRLAEFFASTDVVNSILTFDALRPYLVKGNLRDFVTGDVNSDYDNALTDLNKAHPDYGSLLDKVFEDKQRLEQLVGLRNVIVNPEHRFFLALLLNLENQEQVFALIKARYPEEDPKEKTLDWISELSSTRVMDSTFENGLGIKGFGDTDVLVLEELIDGKTEEEVISELNPESDESISETLKNAVSRIENAGILSAILN